MKQYNYLKAYIYNNMTEADKNISVQKPHFFIEAAPNILDQVELLERMIHVKVPDFLKEFYTNVGSGQFYCALMDEYIGKYTILSPVSVIGIYLTEYDSDSRFISMRRDANEYLHNNALLAFGEFTENSLLYIGLEDQMIYLSPYKKIETSFPAFIQNLYNLPDYFVDDADE